MPTRPPYWAGSSASATITTGLPLLSGSETCKFDRGKRHCSMVACLHGLALLFAQMLRLTIKAGLSNRPKRKQVRADKNTLCYPVQYSCFLLFLSLALFPSIKQPSHLYLDLADLPHDLLYSTSTTQHRNKTVMAEVSTRLPYADRHNAPDMKVHLCLMPPRHIV